MYSKEQIDADAEREAKALSRQGVRQKPQWNRIRQKQEYNRDKFERLFK